MRAAVIERITLPKKGEQYKIENLLREAYATINELVDRENAREVASGFVAEQIYGPQREHVSR